VWIAAGLGGGLHRFTGGQAKELINLRQKLGMPDPRAGLKECELCDSADFRPGVVCAAPAKDAAPSDPADPQIEAIVAKITEQILKQMGK
jgi:L-fuculose-phosphate aldolase